VSALPRLARTAALAAAAALTLLAAGLPAEERVTVTILATTDVHGFLLPYDYVTAKPAPRGLAAAATLIAEVRRETPNTLLIDCGDTIQGSPLEGVHQAAVRAGKSTAPDPMMLAMNALGYDAMVLGNHEFNYGLKNLAAARVAGRFPWISANTRTGDTQPAFAPYLVKSVGGVKVAIVGVTTPSIPEWEKPEQIQGMSWVSPEEGVERALAQLEAEKPDVVVVAAHTGLGRDPQTGTTRLGEVPGENGVWAIAERFPRLAAVIYGHTHQREAGLRVGNVLVVQPRNWAMDVARVDLALTREPGGGWTFVGATSQLLPVKAETPADPHVAAIAAPYHEAAERYLDRPVATAAVELSGARGRFEDTALVDAIQKVQLHYAKADVSFSSLFNAQVRVAPGPVTVRQLAALYIYDNELYAVEGSGKMVREALENAARYFRTCPEPTCSTGPLIDRSVFGFNYDIAQGVSYEIDLTEPVGHRVKNLRFRGQPLRDDQPLRIAVNNYRAAGSAGYAMFREAKIVWRSGREIRDLMADYFIERKQLPDKADGNWRIVPARAVETLAAGAETAR
jgi:2',3'-cyclic-nucleotide 2'-phosphodiesterase/3'-nucleotidase